ncbi:MAG: hypothetical protein ACK559_32615, partial [bacterium]
MLLREDLRGLGGEEVGGAGLPARLHGVREAPGVDLAVAVDPARPAREGHGPALPLGAAEQRHRDVQPAVRAEVGELAVEEPVAPALVAHAPAAAGALHQDVAAIGLLAVGEAAGEPPADGAVPGPRQAVLAGGLQDDQLPLDVLA